MDWLLEQALLVGSGIVVQGFGMFAGVAAVNDTVAVLFSVTDHLRSISIASNEAFCAGMGSSPVDIRRAIEGALGGGIFSAAAFPGDDRNFYQKKIYVWWAGWSS